MLASIQSINQASINQFNPKGSKYPINQVRAPWIDWLIDSKSGRVNLILKLSRHLVVTEWKAIRIDYLDIKPGRGRSLSQKAKARHGMVLSREAKASILNTYMCDDVLGLKFSKNDITGRGGKTSDNGSKTTSLQSWETISQVLKCRESWHRLWILPFAVNDYSRGLCWPRFLHFNIKN